MQQATKTHTTTRRALLAGAAAAPLSFSAPSGAGAGNADSPSLVVFREWLAAYDEYFRTSRITDEDEPLDHATGVVNDVERRIAQLPADPCTPAVIIAWQLYEVIAGTISDDWYRGGAIRSLAAAMLPTMPQEVSEFVAPLVGAAVATVPARWEGGAA